MCTCVTRNVRSVVWGSEYNGVNAMHKSGNVAGNDLWCLKLNDTVGIEF